MLSGRGFRQVVIATVVMLGGCLPGVAQGVCGICYNNGSSQPYWYHPGSGYELLDYGQSDGGEICKIYFAYVTTASSPGNVTVRFYNGTSSVNCPGSYLDGWVFSDLNGSGDGLAHAFVYEFDVPVEDRFTLAAGAFGYSYEFDNSNTGVYLATGGNGSENLFWEDCSGPYYFDADGDPWAGFYMQVYTEAPAEGEIRVEPLSLEFDCNGVVIEPLGQSGGMALDAGVEAKDLSKDISAVDVVEPVEKLLGGDVIMNQFDAGADKVKVIVNLVPSLSQRTVRSMLGNKNRQLRGQLRSAVSRRQGEVLAKLGAMEFSLRHRFENQAGFSGYVNRQCLKRLLNNPKVQSVEPVYELEPHLSQGINLMHAAAVRAVYDGAGVSIAICDTGIDYSHPMLGGGGFPNSKVIGGYDFGDNDSNPAPASSQGHGTCCAGIAAGDITMIGDYIGGVAPGAKLYALKITAGTSGSASSDDMVAAWDWCVSHQNDDPANPIMVISTSFGGERHFEACDDEIPSMTTAANNAVAAGITVLASSANDGYCDSMAWPACISSVMSVGAVYDAAFGTHQTCVNSASCATKYAGGGCSSGYYALDITAADMVSSYSNTADFLDILAPSNRAYTTDIVGSGGYSSGDYSSGFGGTSAACPYAGGAAACLQSAAKAINGEYLSQEEVKKILLSTGDFITDGKVAISKPRVNLERAAEALTWPGKKFTIYNDGSEGLNVSSIVADAGGSWLTFWPAGPCTIGVGGSLEVYVDADCNSCDVSDRLIVYSDDPVYSPYPDGVYVNVARWYGDMDKDCRVNINDLAVLAEHWLESGVTVADLNGDGTVDMDDFAILAARWLTGDS